MGCLFSCCCPGSGTQSSVDPETRRQQMAEAAEQRQQQSDGRGIKDPVALKAKQKRLEDAERAAQERERYGSTDDGGGMRWQVD